MYLYKYVSRSVLDKIIEKKMIRFTQTCYLNDPYEGHIYEDPSNEVELEPYFKKQIESGEILAKEIHQLQIKSISDNPSRISNAVAKAKHDFDHKYGVLSLSRNPRSLLMWAHYAENHKGCVVELNKNSLPSKEKFGDVLFDINNGSVVYSSIKGDNYIRPKLTSSQIGLILKHDPKKDLSCLINKSLEWAYEEEVRIIRDLSLNGHDEIIKLEKTGEDLCLYRLDPGCISSIILGARFNDDALQLKIKANGIKIKQAEISKERFELLIRDNQNS